MFLSELLFLLYNRIVTKNTTIIGNYTKLYQ